MLERLPKLAADGSAVSPRQVVDAVINAGRTEALLSHLEAVSRTSIAPVEIAQRLIERGDVDKLITHLADFRRVDVPIGTIARLLFDKGYFSVIEANRDAFGGSTVVDELISRWHRDW